MARLNVANKTKITPHEGAPAQNINARQQLERSVMSCLLWENEFYEDGVEIAKRITDLCAQVPAEQVADIAIRAKKDMRLRHVPLLLGRELARTKDGRTQLKRVFPEIINRVDDIPEFIAMYWKDGKIPLAKQIDKGLGEAFRKFDEYQLAKYNGGSKAIKLKDVMKLVRPKPADEAQANLWKKLIKGELVTPDTWEVAISACKTDEEKKVQWERLINESKLGGLATLRNIRNMVKHGVTNEVIEKAITAINPGKLLPINFISAAKYNVKFEHLLETKFLACFNNKEKLPGKTTLLIDVSGSMDAKLSGKSELMRLDVACSLAMIAREMCDELRIYTFSNHIVEVPARRGFALRDAIINSQPHSGTELGGAVRAMPKDQRLIVLTDEQSSSYVEQRKGYMINVASARNGVGYGQWTHIDGWSDKVLTYILKCEQ